MPDWLLALIVGLGGGLVGTLLKLSHDRSSELRSRMLDAADNFVDAFTTARDTTAAGLTSVNVFRTIDEEENIPDPLRQEWETKREAKIKASREACDALKRREPRISLLFGRYSPVTRSAFLAYAALSTIAHSLDQKDGPDEEATNERFRQADRALDQFGANARAAIAASPWSPFVARVRTARRELLKRARRPTSRRA